MINELYDNKTPFVVPDNDVKDAKAPQPSHKWLCGSCGKMRTQSPCEYCGKE